MKRISRALKSDFLRKIKRVKIDEIYSKFETLSSNEIRRKMWDTNKINVKSFYENPQNKLRNSSLMT